MQALILAAGLGRRLAPLTDTLPKALLEVRGATLLEHVARRLVAAGCDRLVVNAHHHADLVARFVETHDLGAQVVLSREASRPLETGGALLAARPYLRPGEPFLVHNVDVLTDLSLPALWRAHEATGALATLAAMQRPTARRLLVDDRGLLGRIDETRALRVEARAPEGAVAELGFAGVHVASGEVFHRITERGAFSVLEPWLRWVAEGARIAVHRVDGCRWIDVGRPDTLERARREA
jgi:N-acetyl-alpha-D-muramate 1-phosphate uridylyltransferase